MDSGTTPVNDNLVQINLQQNHPAMQQFITTPQQIQDNNMHKELPNFQIDNQNNSGSDKKSSENKDLEQDKSDENKAKKHKRRTNVNASERVFVCKTCGKAYLSYPALYTHSKQKHSTTQNNNTYRGRGRPPKHDLNDTNNERSQFNPINASFFLKEERKGSTQPSQIPDLAKAAFEEIYSETYKSRNQKKGIRDYKSIADHPFLNLFLKDEHDLNKKLEDHLICTDVVLIYYLNKMTLHCNPEYYTKLIKFVLLFREHVNANFKDIDPNYTQNKDAEDVPDSSNEFITEFLDPENKDSDFNFGFLKEEAIDLTQNICSWMYENNFTSSKLSLIQSDK